MSKSCWEATWHLNECLIKKADHLICPTYIMNVCFNSLRDCVNHRPGVLRTQEHLSGCLPTLLYPHFTEKWWRLEWLAAFLKVIKVKIVVQTPLVTQEALHARPASPLLWCWSHRMFPVVTPEAQTTSAPCPFCPSCFIHDEIWNTCFTGSQLNYHNPGSLSVHRITVQYFPYLWSLSLPEAGWYC